MQRNDVIEIADQLLASAVDFYTPNSGRIAFPGAPSKWGTRSDGMEGFARTLLLGAFRLRGTPDETRPEWLDTFVRGLSEGTHNGGWVKPEERSQSVVESASIALSLQLAPEDLWYSLDAPAQARIVGWMRDAVKAPIVDNNWVMFSQVIAQFLVMVGRRDADTDYATERSLQRLESWYRGDGLYTDGEGQTFDYYNAWAFHFYPPLLAYLRRDTKAMQLYGERLSEYVPFVRSLLDPISGAPVYQGRSLIYRFAAVAPLAMAALYGVVDPDTEAECGVSWSRALKYFIDRGSIEDGVLVPGWHGLDTRLMQRYSGPASPYWASKAFVSLLIDDDAIFWKGSQDVLSHVIEPGAQATKAGLLATNKTGVAVLHNHGADHQMRHHKSFALDDPLYARRSYSSRTSPQVVADLPDNSLVILRNGRQSGRGHVRATTSGTNWVSSEVRETRELPWARWKILDHPKLSWLGPRVRCAGDVIKETTRLTDDGTAMHIYEFSSELQDAQILLTGWPLSLRDDISPLDELIDTEACSWSATSHDTTVELRGVSGFARIEVKTGEASGPHGGYVRIGVLTARPDARVLVLASRIAQAREYRA